MVQLECRYPDPTPQIPFQLTYARAFAKINDTENIVEEYGGLESGHQWLAGANVIFKTPPYSAYPMVQQVVGGTKRNTSAKSIIGRVVFDPIHHVIHLYDIRGSIEVESFDKANDFGAIAISITNEQANVLSIDQEPTDEEYVKRLVWETKCLFNNGRLSMKGAFKSNHFVSKVDGDKLTATMHVKHISIPIDPSIDMSLLQVNMGVDNGNIGMGISDKFKLDDAVESVQIAEAAELNELLEFSNYPNPVADRTTQAYIKINRTERVQLLLCDENGVALETIFDGTVGKDQQRQFRVSLKKITGRVGYLKLILPDKVLVRKILLTL